MKKHYKIGARGSLLSVTQTKLMQKKLQDLTGDVFDIITIKTQGDMNTSAPLWQMQGKDFFTKELDEALLKGEIDLVVHSYKDLGSIRPEGIKLAAVTKRSFAHDILLIKNATIAKLKTVNEVVVGTSSPRRIVNIEKKLAQYLPYCAEKKITTKMLRGNVNTRIKKLVDGEFDAIVLAMAGLERLTSNEEALKELQILIKDLNFFILPQSIFPSSASQGALAVECLESRTDNNELLNKLALLNDEKTIEEVRRERKAFNAYGGGCHLAVGIHVRKVGDHFLHYHEGTVDNQVISVKTMEPAPAITKTSSLYFLGMGKKSEGNILYDELILKTPLAQNLSSHNHYFVTSRHCLHNLNTLPKNHFLWSAGAKTHKKMVDMGLWVNGSADSLGAPELKAFLDSKLIQLFMQNHQINADLRVLTNDESRHELGPSVACYTRSVQTNIDGTFSAKIKQTKLFYWTSFFQYQTYLKLFPELTQNDTVHTCGLGKTWQEFSEHKIAITPIPDPGFLKTL